MISKGSISPDVSDVHVIGTDWIPECHVENKPHLLQKFPDLDSAFQFYKEYGRMCGFDVRRLSEKSDRFGKTVRKYFLCSRDGISDNGSFDSRSNSTNGFSVKKFDEAHNHSFARKGGMQFLRCSRSLMEFHKRFIIDAAKSNVGASMAHAIFKSMIGSYEDVGATVVDFKNFSRDIKQYIEKHDANMIVQKFKDIQESSDNGFRFEYKTNSKNHLTQLFWTDGIGRRNYEVFGDVVSFDATYRTNRYGMVFIPLIGIDNHWKSVTFGAMLLECEDTDNYIWACEAFKKVFGKDPKCIITDQDLSMKVALDTCFPLVKHRLCMWHIMKKFLAKLGTLFYAESPFMEKLKNFIWNDHASPTEFEKGWNDVVSEFGLENYVWRKEMFDLRAFWIPAYFNDEPMVGLLRTTSRSESSNFYFSHYIQKGDILSEFYLCYQSTIERQRNSNDKLNHYDDLFPKTVTKKKIEKEAAALYTRAMFYKIQEEIITGGGDIEIESMFVVDNIKTTKLKDPINKKKSFESIPQQYVNNMWLKYAEERFSTLEFGEISYPNLVEGTKRGKTKDCWFEFQGCISDASGNPEIIEYINHSLKAIRKHIKESVKKPNTCLNTHMIEELINSQVVEEITILNPNQSNNKESRKRIVGSDEKSIGCKKRKTRLCKSCNDEAYHDSRNCPHK